MDIFALIGVATLLVAVLSLLGLWQRRIEHLENRRVRDDLRDAKEQRSDRPIAQHPEIDVAACIGCGSCVAVCPEEGVLGLVDGVAHVIHASRCIGHARCAEACPVGAVKVGLGALAFSPDMPVLSEELESSVPGIWIAGELGGLALIRVATEQGIRVVSQIAKDIHTNGRSEDREVLDLLIVGAGPAGIASSLRARECRLRYATIDQDDIGGTVRKYPRRKLTLTGPLRLPIHGNVHREEFLKEELIEFWEELIARHELRITTGIKLLGAERDDEQNVVVVRTSEGVVRARHLLLALGRRGTPRRLEVPGEESERVLYQLIDAATYNDEKLLVVGGGDSAVEAANALADQRGNTIVLSYRRDSFFRLKPRNLQRIEQYTAQKKVKVLFNSRVQRFEEGSAVLRVATNGVERAIKLPASYSFVFAGGEPPYALLRSMGVKFNGDDQGVLTLSEPPGMVEVSS